MEIHPAAAEFPLLPEPRLNELADDIRRNGQLDPIRLYDGQIIDGRNRYRACEMLGIEPRTENLPADIDPYAYVWSLNGERRDLTQDQRYLIWKSCNEKSEAWQAKQRRIRDEANRKRSEKQAGVPKAEAKERRATTSGTTLPPPQRSSTAAAEASKTNRGAVERMDWLSRESPELAEKVKLGELPAATAIREAKRKAIVAKLEDVSTKEVKAAEGVYDVIVLDPPWPMQKIERDVRPNQSEFDYPVMQEDELASMDIPAAADCHVWLWTTHKFLPMAFRLLDAWELKYVCTFVWHKPGGFQPVGLPQYNCEFALYARKGSPQFVETKSLKVCFEAARGAHSEKPEPFYEMVRRVTAGRRLDMFNRRQIEGFDGWGKEAA